MMVAHPLVFGSLTTLLLVACGGASSTDPGTSSSSSSSGGSSSGGSSSGGSSSGDACVTHTESIKRACVPGTAKANTPLKIEVDTAGCKACDVSTYSCKVALQGDTLRLSFSSYSCPAADGPCPSTCGVPKTTCELPALPAGTYTIDVSETGTSTPGALPAEPRQLVVAAVGETGCTLEPLPPKLDTLGYSKTCNAPTDCVAVFSGDVCTGSCESAAIAATEQERYEAQRRAKRSQCPPQENAPGGPCAQPAVACTAGKCTLGP